jgi:hypothetical protein
LFEEDDVPIGLRRMTRLRRRIMIKDDEVEGEWED